MIHLINNITEFSKSIDKQLIRINKNTSKQIQSQEEKSSIQAHIFPWFNNYRNELLKGVNDEVLNPIDEICSEILKLCTGNPLRTKIISKFKNLSKELKKLTTDNNVLLKKNNSELMSVPNFSKIIKDQNIEKLIISRWNECDICVHNNAKIAAIVMIGGLLEALLLAKFLEYTNKPIIFGATLTPKDKEGKPLHLKDWTLKNYIEVAHELKWITTSIKDLSIILRDYRNYIHPYKEISKNDDFSVSDINVIWDVSKIIINQIAS